ncbi:MAG: DUF2726 domain-containing protein [Nostocales cyanobacterium LE14-WE4]|nr:DUF2726 domain-containing protein [Anabaena sp. 49633_E8]MCE2703144.1 DUF2726 domain-containing protein [Anabaena sp. 49633_E8]MDJ0502605.1 DUF2726 domain-containing protein [Nostocales cyanobacterium LE14-WE4]
MKYKKNLLVNQSEATTNEELKKAASKYEALVYLKVRIADIVEINQKILTDKDEYSYALKAHFDFVITTESDLSPEFVIEFDGSSHNDPQAQKRDRYKNSICQKYEISLFRIKSNFLKPIGDFPKNNSRSIFAGKFDSLAGWIVETWFLQKAFYEAQDNGLIPEDEPFLWFSVIGHDPFVQSRIYLQKKYQEQLCTKFIPKIIKGHDDNEITWATLAILQLHNGLYIYGESECTSINFYSSSAYDLCEELAILEIVQRFEEIESITGLFTQEQMAKKEEEFRKKYIVPKYLE